MQQLQTEKFHFNPNNTFNWTNMLSIQQDWTSFCIEHPDLRLLVFNLEEGIAFEQQVAGGTFYPLLVHLYEYKPATQPDLPYSADSNLHDKYGQQGSLTFTRLHCVNGVPTTAKHGRVMSSARIELKGREFILTEYTRPSDSSWFSGENEHSTHHQKEYFPYSWDYQEIEVVKIHDDFQVEEQLIRKWKHSKVGTIEVFQSTMRNGKTMTRAVLTDLEDQKVSFNPTSKWEELASEHGRFNYRTGEMNISHRGRVWTERMKRAVL